VFNLEEFMNKEFLRPRENSWGDVIRFRDCNQNFNASRDVCWSICIEINGSNVLAPKI